MASLFEETQIDNISQDDGTIRASDQSETFVHSNEDDNDSEDELYDDEEDDSVSRKVKEEKPWYKKDVPLFATIITGVVSSMMGAFLADYFNNRKKKPDDLMSNQQIIMLLIQMLANSNNNNSGVAKTGFAQVVDAPTTNNKKPEWIEHTEAQNVPDDKTHMVGTPCIMENWKVRKSMNGEVLDFNKTDQWVK